MCLCWIIDSWNLPPPCLPHYKLNGFTLKYIWKKALSKRVPDSILNRRKAGFPVPYEFWLRNNFKDQIRAILTDRKTIERGYFQKAAVEKLIDANTIPAPTRKRSFRWLLWNCGIACSSTVNGDAELEPKNSADDSDARDVGVRRIMSSPSHDDKRSVRQPAGDAEFRGRSPVVRSRLFQHGSLARSAVLVEMRAFPRYLRYRIVFHQGTGRSPSLANTSRLR